MTYGKSGGKWIDIPIAYNGNVINYRTGMIEKAGFKEIPKDTAGFLELMKALKAKSTPGGFALGARVGRRQCLGALGAVVATAATWSMPNDKVIINSPETVKALEYAKALSTTFVAGTASWNDAFNNKAFLTGEVSLTNNGVSIYAAAKAGAAKGDANEGGDGRHEPLAVADRPGRRADRVPHRLPDDDHEVHQVPERRQGVHGLHDGSRAVQQVAGATRWPT